MENHTRNNRLPGPTAAAPIENVKMRIAASTAPPWIVAFLLFGAGVAAIRLLWPRVSDAWGAVHAQLHLREPS
jgi:hypothetical protein